MTAAPAIADAPEQSPRFLVHLLDYLAKDYGGAVADGKVISASEYREQLEFSDSALSAGRAALLTQRAPDIERNLEDLRRLIAAKADPQTVTQLSRAIQGRVIEVTGLAMAPTQWPNLRLGRQVFNENCAACHGERGLGDGPASAALSPKPANFLAARMRDVSPFEAFNTIRLGVPGTGMAAFNALSDQEAWNVAFYVIGLRYAASQDVTAASMVTSEPGALTRAAAQSDTALEQQWPSVTPVEQRTRLAALRTHSYEDVSGGDSLSIARARLNAAVRAYRSGDFATARTQALGAYLEGIEPIEPRLKANDTTAVGALETQMAAVRRAIEIHVSPTTLQVAVDSANAQIDAAQDLLRTRELSPRVAYVGAAAILLREGFEAVLVIIALLGVVRAAGSRKAALWVHGGWIGALAVGALAWMSSGWLMNISGAQRETLEGTTSLIAVTVLLIVGFWLHNQTEIGRWTAFIHGKVQKALDGKNLWGLASIAFVAVFREAFETVLFLRAIWLDGDDDTKFAMAAGVLTSLTFVIALSWATLKFAAKLPVRRLFAASAIIMALLAVILTGKGMHALQETGAVSISSLPVPIPHFDLLGWYPTWETTASQIGVLAIVTALWMLGRRPSAGVQGRAGGSNSSKGAPAERY